MKTLMELYNDMERLNMNFSIGAIKEEDFEVAMADIEQQIRNRESLEEECGSLW